MLHDRIVLLVKYVSDVLAGALTYSCRVGLQIPTSPCPGQATKDHSTLRALSALVASLPASDHKGFREEFDTVRGVPVFLPRSGCS